MGMLDKQLNFCSAMAYNGTPAVVDLGSTFQPASGHTIKGRIQGASVVGLAALVILTGTVPGTVTTVVDTIACTAAQCNAGFNFQLPAAGLSRYVTIGLTSISAGTIVDASLMLNHQTA